MKILKTLAAGTLAALLVISGSYADELTYVDRSAGLQTPQMEGGGTEFEFGDVNGDGHPDLVSIGDHGSPFVNTQEHGVMVWFGNGQGQWSVFQNGNFGYGGIALGDVDNDGLMDIGYGMHHNYTQGDFGDQLLEVALGDGTGHNWIPWDDGLATNGESWGMFGTDFADVDNDGDLDIGSISFGCCAGVHVYLNHGDGSWSQSFGFTGGTASMIFRFADFNGDGNADFASAHGDGTVYFGDGTGGFTNADANLGSVWRGGVSTGDLNGDGRDDLSFRTSSGAQAWTWSLESGQWENLTGSLATVGDTNLTEIADMNLDGFGDVVTFGSDRLQIHAGDGAGGWTLLSDLDIPENCGRAALRAGTDADHNGFPDLVFVQEENCGIFGDGTNRPRFFAESSVPAEPFIFPKYPRGGELWRAGSVRFIDWHAGVPGESGTATMTIELSLSGPDGPWTVIAQDVPNNGRYQFVVPANTPGSIDCRLRYTLSTAPESQATTPASFEIIGDAIGLIDFDVVTGSHIAGGLAELGASDDTHLQTRSRFGFTAFEPNVMELVLAAVMNDEAPATIDLGIESRLNHPVGEAKIRLRDWTNNGWEQVGTYSIGVAEEMITFDGRDASDHVRGGDRRVELSVRHVVMAVFSAAGFDSYFDLVTIQAD